MFELDEADCDLATIQICCPIMEMNHTRTSKNVSSAVILDEAVALDLTLFLLDLRSSSSALSLSDAEAARARFVPAMIKVSSGIDERLATQKRNRDFFCVNGADNQIGDCTVCAKLGWFGKKMHTGTMQSIQTTRRKRVVGHAMLANRNWLIERALNLSIAKLPACTIF